MRQSGEYRIQAGLDEVWSGLNDPEILAACIDGCTTMEKVGDDRFETAVKAKVGPLSATFQAVLQLTDVQAPSRYTINADVKGGSAGFGKGSARVELLEDPAAAGATLLRYEVNGSVGGKLAQVGSRLIDGVMRKMADDFFAAFGESVSGQEPQAISLAAPGEERGGVRWGIWLGLLIALILLVLLVM